MSLGEVFEMVWNGVVAVMLWSGLGITFTLVSQDPHQGTLTATIITVILIVQNYVFRYI